MEIVYTDGCTATGIDIDGEDLRNLSVSKQRRILHRMINKIDENIMYDVFKAIALNGEFRPLYYCNQCGDDVVEYRLKI